MKGKGYAAVDPVFTDALFDKVTRSGSTGLWFAKHDAAQDTNQS